jgi:hypothetical protein
MRIELTGKEMATMKSKVCTLTVVAVIAVLLAPCEAAAGLASSQYVVPVVARNPGAAGADWRTELCVVNPEPNALTITLALVQGGGLAGGGNILLQPGETMCSDDFLFEWFGETTWQGALILGAEENSNPGLDPAFRFFMVSVKVYNLTQNGTFGLSVTPEPVIEEFGNIGLLNNNYFATGLHNWGRAGVNGFRTSVGLFNVRSVAQEFGIVVVDSSINVVWQKVDTVPPFTQVQYSLPRNLTFEKGSVLFQFQFGEILAYPYATVTDNETGDGRYITGTQYWIPMVKSADSLAGDPDPLSALLALATELPPVNID